LFMVPWERPKIVFITDNAYTGDLLNEAKSLSECAHVTTGLDGGDCICQSIADQASVEGIFKAWLSDSQQSPATRFAKFAGPYAVPRMPVPIFIGYSYADVTDGTLLRPITRTIHARRSGLVFAWTGTQGGGGAAGEGNDTQNCDDWTGPVSGKGVVGQIRPNSTLWSEFRTQKCTGRAALYCFEQ